MESIQVLVSDERASAVLDRNMLAATVIEALRNVERFDQVATSNGLMERIGLTQEDAFGRLEQRREEAVSALQTVFEQFQAGRFAETVNCCGSIVYLNEQADLALSVSPAYTSYSYNETLGETGWKQVESPFDSTHSGTWVHFGLQLIFQIFEESCSARRVLYRCPDADCFVRELNRIARLLGAPVPSYFTIGAGPRRLFKLDSQGADPASLPALVREVMIQR